MLASTKELHQWIKAKYNQKYVVLVENDGKNCLPDKERNCYEPDVIMRDSNSEIKYIIELEGDPGRKALVGASILADYSISVLMQVNKPKLIFVVHTANGIKQMHNFVEKLKIAKLYCSNLDNIEIYSEVDFKGLQL